MAQLRTPCLPLVIFTGVKLSKLNSLPTAATFLFPLLEIVLGRKLYVLVL